MKTYTIAIMMATLICLNLAVIEAWWVKANNGELCLSPCIYGRQGDFYLDGIEIKNGNSLSPSCSTDYIYDPSTRHNISLLDKPPQLFDTSRTLHEFHTCSPDRLLYEGGYVLADNGRYCTSKCEKNTCYTIENYIRPTTCDPSNVISNDQQQYLTRYGIFCTGPCRPINTDGVPQHTCYADYQSIMFWPQRIELCSIEEGFSVKGKICTSPCSKNGKDYYWCDVDPYWWYGLRYDWDHCSPPFEKIENCDNEITDFSGNFESYPSTFMNQPEDLEELCPAQSKSSSARLPHNSSTNNKANEAWRGRWVGWPYLFRVLRNGQGASRERPDEGNGHGGIMSRYYSFNYGYIGSHSMADVIGNIYVHVLKDPGPSPLISTMTDFEIAENVTIGNVIGGGNDYVLAIVDATQLQSYHYESDTFELFNLNELAARLELGFPPNSKAHVYSVRFREVVIPYGVPREAVVGSIRYSKGWFGSINSQYTQNVNYRGNLKWPPPPPYKIVQNPFLRDLNLTKLN